MHRRSVKRSFTFPCNCLKQRRYFRRSIAYENTSHRVLIKIDNPSIICHNRWMRVSCSIEKSNWNCSKLTRYSTIALHFSKLPDTNPISGNNFGNPSSRFFHRQTPDLRFHLFHIPRPFSQRDKIKIKNTHARTHARACTKEKIKTAKKR